ncbi:MAG: acyltransferase [Cyanobacteria bacterium SIG26]|nr:acyltransferase [Cyanobacteria bacterium SIG26]
MEKIQTKPKRQMLNYINIFRGLAILLIVAGHTMQFGSQGTWINNIAFEILTGGTVLFIFISGFLFQYLSDKFEYKTYLKKKWTNVILPYLITAIPGIILCFTMPVTYGNPFDGLNPLAQIGVFLTTGRVHNVPTWYIPMIVIFFLLADIFIILERKKILYKLLPVLFLITIFVPRMAIEPEYLTGMSYGAKYWAYLSYILNGFAHFASMYIFGMYLSANRDKISLCYKHRWPLIILMLLTSFVDVILLHNFNISNGTISKIFLTLIVLGYLNHYDDAIKNCNWFNNGADFIAKYSFAIFFVHWYLNFAFNRIFDVAKVIPASNGQEFIIALGIVIVRYFAVLGTSLGILYILKTLLSKIGIKNTRAVIGV